MTKWHRYGGSWCKIREVNEWIRRESGALNAKCSACLWYNNDKVTLTALVLILTKNWDVDCLLNEIFFTVPVSFPHEL